MTYSLIVLAMDGSESASSGGSIALRIAGAMGAEIVVCHVYDAQIHQARFRDMEPGLPAAHQEAESLGRLRKSHDSLISEGFEALSQGYTEDFLTRAGKRGIVVRAISVPGRNYVKILELARDRRADLIVLGAHGIGTIGDGLLGSTANRVVRHAGCDVLIARRSMNGGGILIGIDGSDSAASALQKGAALGRALAQPVHIAAVYDPIFHHEVFKTMARSLSAERQEAVGLARQEELHEQIIDGGLGRLYQSFLRKALTITTPFGVDASTELLRGKPYQALGDHVQRIRADLLVVGRYGHHREGISQIGSNAEALARRCLTNVLVAAPDGYGMRRRCSAKNKRSAPSGRSRGSEQGVETLDDGW